MSCGYKHPLSLTLLILLAASASGCRMIAAENSPSDFKFSTVFGASDGAYMADKEWNDAADNEFSAWVEQLGRELDLGTCAKLGDCITSKQANSIWSPEDKTLNVFADASDTPTILRAYFSFKTKRPFQYVSEISGNRYSLNNKPLAWKSFAEHKSINEMLSQLSNSVHSGFFRTASNMENTDTFPIDISRESVKPGTVFYDPNGNILIVYRIDENGSVRLLDGHTDNTLSTHPFTEKFARGSASLGGGFRNWRRTIISPDSAKSTFHLTRDTNAQSKFFSATAQYNSDLKLENGNSLDYYKWVQTKLAAKTALINPVEEFYNRVVAICQDIKARAIATDAAVEAEIFKKQHPGLLPENIYGAAGEWERWSTPARDTRLRASFRGLNKFVQESFVLLKNDKQKIDFDGTAAELALAYHQSWNAISTSAQCLTTYKNSSKQPISISLDVVTNRIFDLSFDPYHCPELRWGARPARGGKAADPETITCPSDTTKEAWYWKQARIRNTIDRVFELNSSYDTGPSTSEKIDVRQTIENLLSTSDTKDGEKVKNSGMQTKFSTDGVNLTRLESSCHSRSGGENWRCLEQRGCGYNPNTRQCFVLGEYKSMIVSSQNSEPLK